MGGKNVLRTAVLGYIFIFIQTKHKYIIPCTYWAVGGKI